MCVGAIMAKCTLGQHKGGFKHFGRFLFLLADFVNLISFQLRKIQIINVYMKVGFDDGCGLTHINVVKCTLLMEAKGVTGHLSFMHSLSGV